MQLAINNFGFDTETQVFDDSITIERVKDHYNIMTTDTDMKTNMSKRFQEWEKFAQEVGDHIECYTVPQYGDMPNDQASAFTIHDIKTNMMRYINRIGSNSRGPEEELRDLLKIAHYACMAWSKKNGTYDMIINQETISE